MARLRSRDLFPTDAPLPAAQLIGRTDVVTSLTDALTQGMHQVVLGPRRTGKTSVCRAALEQLDAAGAYVVSIDLFALANRAELATALVQAAIANRGPLARGAQRLRAAGRALTGLAGATLTAKLKAELGEDIEIAYTPALANRDPDRSLDYALRLLQRIAEADDVQLVVFIDEFQELAHPRAPYGDPDALTKQMRTVLQDSSRVVALFSGSIDHLMRDLFVPERRAFYRFGTTRRLPPIPPAAWHDGLRARYAEDSVRCTVASLDRLLERSGGHPRSTLLIAQHAHLSIITDEAHELTMAAVEEGFYSALAGDAIGHGSQMEQIRALGAAAVEVVRRIAGGARPYAGSGKPRPTERALTALLNAGLLEKHARGEYELTDPLFAHYVRNLGR